MSDLAYTSMALATMAIILAFVTSVTLFAALLLVAIVREIHNAVRSKKKYGDDF